MTEPAIQLSQVTKRFGTKVAVSQVSFTVAPGQCFGLIGPNGAGKTTTFSMMCGFLHPDEGELRVLGSEPRQPGALKHKLGVLPQDAVLPPMWPVGTLLTYWARLTGLPSPEAEARRVLERVGLAETWKTLAGALSHGMAKRVALAQALMGSPPVVLLDEPTAGLDPKVAASVRDIIRQMRGAQTVVVSSHNLHELEELCDATALLDRGSLVTAGSMADLTGQGAEFRVHFARGEPRLDVLRAIAGCTNARIEAAGVLTVQFDGQETQPEDIISAALEQLLKDGVKVLGVHRGHRLEDKVLQLT